MTRHDAVEISCLECLEQSSRARWKPSILAVIDGVTHAVWQTSIEDYGLRKGCDFDDKGYLKRDLGDPIGNKVNPTTCVALTDEGRRMLHEAARRTG